MLQSVSRLLTRASRILFWPGVVLVVWGELRPRPLPVAALIWDKAEHFTAYFGLAAMATMVLRRGRRLVWALFGVIALGAVLEVLQTFTGRDAEGLDVLANTIGVLSGFGVAALLLALVAREGGGD